MLPTRPLDAPLAKPDALRDLLTQSFASLAASDSVSSANALNSGCEMFDLR